MNGDLVDNDTVELPEQLLLQKYIKKNDTVLQLGGNIGTSCIYTEKMGATTICVEPIQQVAEILERNKKYNNVSFQVINAIIAPCAYPCRQQMNVGGANSNSSYVVKSDIIDVSVVDLEHLNLDFNVIFADCEGCLPKFINDYPFVLDKVRLILYEKDKDDGYIYDNMNNVIVKKGFELVESGFLNVLVKISA